MTIGQGLGAQLQAAGLNEPALVELLGAAFTDDDIPLVLERYGSADPRSALVRMFVLGERVDAAALPIDVDGLADLVEQDGDTVAARVRLMPYAGLLVPHDRADAGADVVTGVNAASRTLATLTVRRGGERALDLGTGSGVEALLAARHATSVVATDVNPHALELARLASALNELPLDLRLGSLFEPVAGERFDLIVANPPFVISPDTQFVFRDSELPGDAICREVVRGAAAHLEEGGFATVLCNWIVRDEVEPWRPLERWVEDLPCDAVLIAHGVVEPLRYATRWNEPLRGRPEYGEAVGRWLDYYEREEVRGIGIGAVVLRGAAQPGWVRGFTAPRPATGDAGAHLLRLFAAGDRAGADLLDQRIRLVPGHRLEQTLVYGEEYDVAGVVMSLAEGAGLVAAIEPTALPLLFELDGETSVRAAAASAAVDDVTAAALVRDLVDAGLAEIS